MKTLLANMREKTYDVFVKTHRFCLFVCLFFVFCSCNSNVIYDENKSVDEKAWAAKDKVYYQVDIKNTAMK